MVGGSILGKLVEFLLSYDTILLNQLVALSRVHRLRGADTPGEQSLWVGLWCAMSPASISVQPCRICHTKYEVKVLMAGRGWAHVVRSNDAYNLAFYQPVRTFCNAIQKSTAHTEGVACECGAAQHLCRYRRLPRGYTPRRQCCSLRYSLSPPPWRSLP